MEANADKRDCSLYQEIRYVRVRYKWSCIINPIHVLPDGRVQIIIEFQAYVILCPK